MGDLPVPVKIGLICVGTTATLLGFIGSVGARPVDRIVYLNKPPAVAKPASQSSALSGDATQSVDDYVPGNTIAYSQSNPKRSFDLAPQKYLLLIATGFAVGAVGVHTYCVGVYEGSHGLWRREKS
ncbi:hypothetical protein HYU16_01505 [Candidatus Woesearchaeota archaeon]|nr:hypothetical protein [Candidatus Woesearchaeota archaeon]